MTQHASLPPDVRLKITGSLLPLLVAASAVLFPLLATLR